jgi:PEGA domain
MLMVGILAAAGPTDRVAVLLLDAPDEDLEGQVRVALETERLNTVGFEGLEDITIAEQDGVQALGAAKEAYDNLDYEVAQTKLRLALDAFDTHPEQATSQRLAEAHFLLAVVTLQSGAKGAAKKAQDSFVRALLHDGRLQLDAKQYGVDVKHVFDKATAEVGKLPKASLRIDSEPPGARVTVQEQVVGRTPIPALRLPVGRHLLHFARTGYTPTAAFADVTKEGTTAMVVLKPLAAVAEVRRLAKPLAVGLGKGKVPTGARALAERLEARYLVVGAGTAFEVWDTQSGNQLSGLTSANVGSLAKQVKAFVVQPSVVPSPVGQGKQPPELAVNEPVYKKWWFWTAVGVVVVGGATAGGVAAASAHGRPFNVVLGTP